MNGGKLVIGIETDTKSFDAQIEATRRKLEMLEKSADESKMPKSIRRTAEEQQKLNVEIEKTRNELIRLQNLQNQDNKESSKGWNLKLSGLKKFAMGLIGIRGIYSLVRKASSTWLSQDTELAKKFQNMWLVIGAALQPVLEALANVFMKLIGYLNVFVKAFTGGKVDLIAKANAQALKKQSEAMKELKNQTYGFDELNIQQTNQGSSSSSGLGGIVEPQLNENVAKVIGDIGKGLKNISDWVEENLGTNGPITLGIAGIIGWKLLGGGGVGLLGIVATLVLIYETLKLIEAAKAIPEINKTFEQNTEGMKDYNKQIEEITDNYEELAKTGKMTREEEERWGNSLKTLNQGIKEHSDSLAEVKGFTGKTKEEQKELLKQTDLLVDSYEKMDETIGLNTQTASEYLRALEAQRTVTKNLGQDTKDVDKKIDDLKNRISKLDGIKASPQIEAEWKLIDKSGDIYAQIKKKLEPIAKLVPFGMNILKGISNKTIDYYLKKLGLSYGATGGVIHKSALGSIVNNPGRGVYVGGNTIAGEAGKEGIIPLTDPNAMAELGETIGRYITVNLTNITKLDSKTINKTNNTISNDMNFIRNGGGA